MYKILFPFTILLLTACGGGGGSSSNGAGGNNSGSVSPSTGAPTLYAGDISTAVVQSIPTVINLANSVASSDNSAVMLASVKNITDDNACDNVETGNLNFTVNASDIGACVYSYEITDTEGRVQASAVTQVAVVGSEGLLLNNNNLTPISATAELSEEIAVTVSTDEVEGMTLSSSITILGSGSAYVNSSESGDAIVYTAGLSEQDAGVTRIIYSYSDSDGNVSLGAIDIAVSTDTLNNAPKAQSYLYTTEEDIEDGLAYTSVPEGKLITIDVSPLVSDDDKEDSLQLVEVQSYNGKVEIAAKEDIANLAFTFMANQAGKYHVMYTISDHKGGFASNIVEIRVVGPWPNVIINDSGDIFSAPLSADAASVAGYDIAGIASEASSPNGNGYSNVPTYTWSAADAICKARGGSLPTQEQFEDFVEQESNPYLENDGNDFEMAHDWPVARNYFTSTFDSNDSNLVATFNTNSGSSNGVIGVEMLSSGEDGTTAPYLGYVACIDKTPQSLEIVNSSLLIQDNITKLTAEFTTASGNTFPYTKPLNWVATPPSDDALVAVPDFDDNVILNSNTGEIVVQNEEGNLDVTATDLLGELSTSKTFEVIDNLFGTITDPTFNSANDNTRGVCEDEDLGFTGDRIEIEAVENMYHIQYWDADSSNNGLYFVHNCDKDQVTDTNDVLLKMKIDNSGASAIATPMLFIHSLYVEPGDYMFSIWFQPNVLNEASPSNDVELVLKVRPDADNSSNAATIGDSGGYVYPSDGISGIELGSNDDGWVQVGNRITVNKAGYATFTVQIESKSTARYYLLDEPTLIPIVED